MCNFADSIQFCGVIKHASVVLKKIFEVQVYCLSPCCCRARWRSEISEMGYFCCLFKLCGVWIDFWHLPRNGRVHALSQKSESWFHEHDCAKSAEYVCGSAVWISQRVCQNSLVTSLWELKMQSYEGATHVWLTYVLLLSHCNFFECWQTIFSVICVPAFMFKRSPFLLKLPKCFPTTKVTVNQTCLLPLYLVNRLSRWYVWIDVPVCSLFNVMIYLLVIQNPPWHFNVFKKEEAFRSLLT